MTAIVKRRGGERARNFRELHRRIRCVEDQHALDQLLQDLRHPATPYIVSFVNANAANLAWQTPSMLENLLDSDLLLRDGAGTELALMAFGYPRGLNMNGTDFIPHIVHAYAGRRAALFGTCSPWLEVARAKLEDAGLMVVASHHGYSTPETYLDLATSTRPDLVVLAMGMPKQESLAVWLRERLPEPVLIVNGGAVLDFLGGKVGRAPKAVRDVRMEWAYRLYLEPRRLVRRYLVGIPTFFSHVGMTRVFCPVETRTGPATSCRPGEAR